MGFDIKKVLGTVAPFLTAALPGPFAGIANAALGSALGTTAKPSDVQAAIDKGLTGDQVLAIKNAENEFQKTMAQLGYENVEKLAEIAAQDRASARDREVKTSDHTPRILAYIYTFALFAVIATELTIGIKQITIDPMTGKTLDMLMGVLVTMVIGSKEYFLGTSAGDDKKTDLLSKAGPIQ